MKYFFHALPLFLLAACNQAPKQADQAKQADQQATPTTDAATFQQDENFLHNHLGNLVTLKSPDDSSMVLVAGDYQARVMTSSAGGYHGKSYGWLNYKLIESGKYNPHINAYGGEERFWLGPEGGQYALFFPKGKPFAFEHWQTPGLIDTAVFDLKDQSSTAVHYYKEGILQNYAGADFQVGISRKITLLNRATLIQQLGFTLPQSIATVAYRTENTLTNKGQNAWQESTGLLSIWLLGMFTPSDKTVIVVPFKAGANARAAVHDDYFGKIPPGYLQVKDSLLLMKANGRNRGKVGLAPEIAIPMAGSVDVESGAITLILFSINKNGKYVNSKWEQQKEPYKGDVVNCYNDGPLADGTQMGPFYELESSSDARPLAPGNSLTYSQTTVHLEGSYATMDSLAQRLWHMSIQDISTAFPK